MTHRRAADRARRDEAAADADQAAALGRHRDPRAGRGAARAHRLLHGAGGRRRGRGDGRVRARRRLPRKFGGDHIDDVRGAVAAYGERIGWPHPSEACRRPPPRGDQVGPASASWAPARRPRRAALAGSAAVEPIDVDRGDRAAARQADRASLRRRTARPAFRAAEERITLELLDDPASEVVALGGGQSRLRGGARVRSQRHTVGLARRRRRDGVAARRGGAGGRWPRDRDAFEASARRARAALRGARRRDRARRRARGRSAEVLAALASAPRGTRVLWAASASGDYPAYIGPGLLGAPLLARHGRRAGASSSPTATSARPTAKRSSRSPAASR